MASFIIFIVVKEFIIKCIISDLGSSCVIVSPLVFSALAVSGVLESIFELGGLIRVLKKKGNEDYKDNEG